MNDVNSLRKNVKDLQRAKDKLAAMVKKEVEGYRQQRQEQTEQQDRTP